MNARSLIFAMLLTGLIPVQARAQDDAKKLAVQARNVLDVNCYRCHGKDGSAEGGFGYVLDVKRLVEKKRVAPSHADKSRIWLRASSTDEDVMPPPSEKPRPTKDDLEILKQWIAAGAPEFPAAEVVEHKRPFLTEADVYKTMYAYLLKAEMTDSAKYQRFFTLTHLHNNPKVSDANLRLYRAGLAKLLNSLSWRRNIVLPKPIDENGVVLAIDLRDLDWDLNYAWDKMVGYTRGKEGYQGYPYALKHDLYPSDPQLNVTATQVYRLAGTSIPAVRVDWFLGTASVPPLYHELANIPHTAYELERTLKVDVALNFRRETLARSGFILGGVSAQNRMAERHHAIWGAYWKSYDFKHNDGDSNLLRLPLGPLNLYPPGKNPYANQAFQHAGGELIWALPNGLHAYMLTDGNGNRINEGPPEVVRDKAEAAGKGPVIVNGLSCMSCHKTGMIELPKDQVRDGAGFQGKLGEKIKRIYPEAKVMKHLLEQDEEDYLRGLEQVIAPYLRIGADKDKDIKLFPEVVSLLASPYLRSLVSAEDAALELGLSDAKELTIAIKNNPKLRDQLGLRTWTVGGSIKRQVWESVLEVYSPFQETAAELQRGTPIRVLRSNYDLP